MANYGMLGIGFCEFIVGGIIAIFGIHIENGFFVAVGAVLLSLGTWAIQHVETKEELEKLGKNIKEVKEELIKIRKQLEKTKSKP